MKLSQLGEFGLIDLLNRQIGKVKAVKGIGDDAAVLEYTKDKYLLFTTDMLMEGVHFTRKISPFWIGHKAMACNISDIAAMGGIPKYAVISLGVSGKNDLKSIKEIYRGLNTCAQKFGVAIVGGDTIKSDKLIINVALIGEVEKKYLVTRSGAKEGDFIFTTGPLGNSLKSGRHLKFTPRVQEARFLVENFKPNAMIDLSDGLASDLGHILKQSKAGAVIDEDKISLRRGANLKQALTDGEDFELLFTVSSEKAGKVMKAKNFKFTPIGRIVESRRNRPLKVKGFTHF